MSKEKNKKDYEINGWTDKEWLKMVEKLKELPLGKIKLLANNLEVKFEGGNESVVDRPQMSAKEQFIMVLDEVPKEIFIREFNKIIA